MRRATNSGLGGGKLCPAVAFLLVLNLNQIIKLILSSRHEFSIRSDALIDYMLTPRDGRVAAISFLT
jgi:hypothetical protein